MPSDSHLDNQRRELLEHISALLEKPMLALAFVWLALVLESLIHPLSPLLRHVSQAIWAVFILQFLTEISIAPHKVQYLKQHWLTVISLLLPALGVLRIGLLARALLSAQASGFLNLVRILTSLNRGMRATRGLLGHHRLGFALALSALVLLAGSAGMESFENPAAIHRAGLNAADDGGLTRFSDALYFTAMQMTTVGSAYSPVTPAGRILTWALTLYAVTIFTYLTANLASFFLGAKKQ